MTPWWPNPVFCKCDNLRQASFFSCNDGLHVWSLSSVSLAHLRHIHNGFECSKVSSQKPVERGVGWARPAWFITPVTFLDKSATVSLMEKIGSKIEVKSQFSIICLRAGYRACMEKRFEKLQKNGIIFLIKAEIWYFCMPNYYMQIHACPKRLSSSVVNIILIKFNALFK